MTKAVFNFKDNQPISFTICGHANFADKGKDIVCSAITTAVFTSINLIIKMVDKSLYSFYQDEVKGIVSFELLNSNSEAEIIIANLLDILNDISLEYPNNIKLILNK